MWGCREGFVAHEGVAGLKRGRGWRGGRRGRGAFVGKCGAGW